MATSSPWQVLVWQASQGEIGLAGALRWLGHWPLCVRSLGNCANSSSREPSASQHRNRCPHQGFAAGRCSLVGGFFVLKHAIGDVAFEGSPRWIISRWGAHCQALQGVGGGATPQPCSSFMAAILGGPAKAPHCNSLVLVSGCFLGPRGCGCSGVTYEISRAWATRWR